MVVKQDHLWMLIDWFIFEGNEFSLPFVVGCGRLPRVIIGADPDADSGLREEEEDLFDVWCWN
jgi:hypothetical protein